MNKLLTLLMMLLISTASYAQDADDLRRAEAGDAWAQLIVAGSYKNGWNGAPQDDEKYVYWLKKSAENGDSMAQDALADLYKYGKHGVSKDISQFLYWAKKAVNNSEPYYPAAFSLGLYYEDFDKQEAIYWYKKAMDICWANSGKEAETVAESLRELGVTYHPGRNSNYASKSNSSIEEKEEDELLLEGDEELLLDLLLMFGGISK